MMVVLGHRSGHRAHRLRRGRASRRAPRGARRRRDRDAGGARARRAGSPTIHARVAELLAEHTPDAVAVEELYFGANAHSALAVGQARGVVLLAAGQRDVPVASYTPQQIKGAVCGSGRAAKDQVQRMVQTLLSLRRRCRGPTTRQTRWRSRSATRTAPPCAARCGRPPRDRAPLRRGRGPPRRPRGRRRCGGVGYRLAVSAETLRHVPAVGKTDNAAHAPDRARRRAGAATASPPRRSATCSSC